MHSSGYNVLAQAVYIILEELQGDFRPPLVASISGLDLTKITSPMIQTTETRIRATTDITTFFVLASSSDNGMAGFTGLIVDRASLFCCNSEVGEITMMQRNPPSSSAIQKFEKTSQKFENTSQY
jgi:hypothetical protein